MCDGGFSRQFSLHTREMKSSVGTLERLIRRLWGLPTGRGFYAEHPSRPNAKRVPGYLENVNGATTLMRKDTWADVEAAKATKYEMSAPLSSKAGPSTRDDWRTISTSTPGKHHQQHLRRGRLRGS